jgi:hypothetical protein
LFLESLKLPGVYEVLFYNETEESPGMMLWRYPEPRVLTLVRITPVPFNTTEDPDISTADLGDVLQVCGGWVFPFQNKSIMRKCLEHTFYISHSKHKYITCVLYLYV